MNNNHTQASASSGDDGKGKGKVGKDVGKRCSKGDKDGKGVDKGAATGKDGKGVDNKGAAKDKGKGNRMRDMGGGLFVHEGSELHMNLCLHREFLVATEFWHGAKAAPEGKGTPKGKDGRRIGEGMDCWGSRVLVGRAASNENEDD